MEQLGRDTAVLRLALRHAATLNLGSAPVDPSIDVNGATEADSLLGGSGRALTEADCTGLGISAALSQHPGILWHRFDTAPAQCEVEVRYDRLAIGPRALVSLIEHVGDGGHRRVSSEVVPSALKRVGDQGQVRENREWRRLLTLGLLLTIPAVLIAMILPRIDASIDHALTKTFVADGLSVQVRDTRHTRTAHDEHDDHTTPTTPTTHTRTRTHPDTRPRAPACVDSRGRTVLTKLAGTVAGGPAVLARQPSADCARSTILRRRVQLSPPWNPKHGCADRRRHDSGIYLFGERLLVTFAHALHMSLLRMVCDSF